MIERTKIGLSGDYTFSLLGISLLLLALGVFGVHCSQYCASCRISIPKCNSTNGVCDSNCRRTKLCLRKDDLCLATWTRRQGELVMFTDCFRLPPFSNSSQFASHCKASALNATRTCLCRESYCNQLVRQPVERRSTKVGVTQSIHVQTVSSNVSEYPFRGVGQGHGTKSYEAITKREALSRWIWISVPVFLLLVSIAARQSCCRKTEVNTLRTALTQQSKTNVQQEAGMVEIAVKGELPGVTLECTIARGRFSTVWIGRMQSQKVAVKIFSETGMSSGQKELGVHSSLSIGHANILKMIALGQSHEEVTGNQFWLVTEYCENGSLRNYLRGRILSWRQAVQIAHEISSGVAFLHSHHINGFGSKVPVAHRDLKSSNVLVRADGTCVISDFGLAMSLEVAGDQRKNLQIGTYRYMSPEELLAAISLESLETFKQMDVYSMALVLWEILSRCSLSNPSAEYQLPYEDMVGVKATLDVMIDIVAVRGERPQVPWQQAENEDMKLLCQTLEECWDTDPEARLTAGCAETRIHDLLLRVKERL